MTLQRGEVVLIPFPFTTLNRDNIVGLFGQLKPKAMARLQGEVCRQLGCRP